MKEKLAMIKIVLGVQTRCLFRTKSEIFGVRFIYLLLNTVRVKI